MKQPASLKFENSKWCRLIRNKKSIPSIYKMCLKLLSSKMTADNNCSRSFLHYWFVSSDDFDKEFPHEIAAKLIYIEADIEDIFRQLSAHLRQASAHRRINSAPSAMLSHSSAHASQMSAHTPQICGWCSLIRTIKSALVRQIWTQSWSNFMWSGLACLPPISKQCPMVSRQTVWQFWQLSMQVCISWLLSCDILIILLEIFNGKIVEWLNEKAAGKFW